MESSACRAGVIEDGPQVSPQRGTPQGGVSSPLLVNIYLHYVFDLWVQHWRKQPAREDVIVIRYADESVLGFESEQWRERSWMTFGNG